MRRVPLRRWLLRIRLLRVPLRWLLRIGLLRVPLRWLLRIRLLRVGLLRVPLCRKRLLRILLLRRLLLGVLLLRRWERRLLVLLRRRLLVLLRRLLVRLRGRLLVRLRGRLLGVRLLRLLVDLWRLLRVRGRGQGHGEEEGGDGCAAEDHVRSRQAGSFARRGARSEVYCAFGPRHFFVSLPAIDRDGESTLALTNDERRGCIASRSNSGPSARAMRSTTAFAAGLSS